jgi:ACS family allantoate permease-like MFS transporter
MNFSSTVTLANVRKFDKIVLSGLGYSDRDVTLMSFPEDSIQLLSVVVAGIASQMIPNSRCALMILANTVVLIGAVLVDSRSHLTSSECRKC